MNTNPPSGCNASSHVDDHKKLNGAFTCLLFFFFIKIFFGASPSWHWHLDYCTLCSLKDYILKRTICGDSLPAGLTGL